MSDLKSRRIRRIIGWGIIGLIAVIGISIALSLYLFPGRAGPFIPFRFGWLGGIFLILIIFWVAKWFFWPWRGWYRNDRGTAESILRERYAKGEITREQFEQMKQVLERKT